ncbi:hypothetical protein V8V91_06465 [Algoriphagus halophilus]|uniref:hypothetical protein n=1 Tax=Algoriphagus halophilus TaxID=226505 RepID=UPI00358F9789
MIGFEGELEFSVILVGLLILLAFAALLWYQLIEKPLEEKRNKVQYEDLLKDQDLIFLERI